MKWDSKHRRPYRCVILGSELVFCTAQFHLELAILIRFIWIPFFFIRIIRTNRIFDLDSHHSNEINFDLLVPESRISTNVLLMQTSLGTIAYDKDSANGASSGPKTSKFQSGHRVVKHRKNCKCCPGHYLIVNHYSSI